MPVMAHHLVISGVSEGFQLEAEAVASSGKKLRKFAMTAYTGVSMNLGWGLPIVVDLAGMKIPSKSIPILFSHDAQQIVGHTTEIEIYGESLQKMRVKGIISGVGDAAQEVIALADNEFPWQASIGAAVDGKMELVEKGETVKVNGRSFSGPLYVARSTILGEVSFVPIGADMNTSATVAASSVKGKAMNPELKTWLEAKGIKAETVAPDLIPVLQASFDAEKKQVAPPPVVTTPVVNDSERIAAQRRADAEESRRISEIRRICAGSAYEIEIDENGRKAKVFLEAHAIENGWTPKEVAREKELLDLRASRPAAPFGYVASGKPAMTGEVLEAALCQTAKIPGVEKQYKPETLEAADRGFKGFTIQQVILSCAAANGYNYRPGDRINAGNIRSVLEHAFLRAGFSTLSLPGILGNVANKAILAGYMLDDSPWRRIAKVVSQGNFHAHSRYRMLDDMEYEILGAGGEIAHGKTDEEYFTTQLDTYAKMYSLTRKSIINDDLGAFDDLQNRIGRGAAKKLRKVVWTTFLSNASTFWTSARGNYITGSTTTLLVDGVGLGLGVKAFRQMKSPTADGLKTIGGQPKMLLVPPELEVAGRVLFQYTGQGAALATAGNVNPWAGMFEPIVVPELSDSNFTGYSTTAWYLLRDPMDLATIYVSFLNGQETPTVESADADFNTLGIQFRGYHDFGCDQADYLGGVKSKGAA